MKIIPKIYENIIQLTLKYRNRERDQPEIFLAREVEF